MRILVCEDERDLNESLVEILKYHKYSVDSVFDGRDAIDYIETDLYDAVILDIMMPKLSGLEVLTKVREQGNSIPILLLTAKSETEDIVEGLNLGADDYLPKPFNSQELVARIRSITRRKSEVDNSTLEYNSLVLNRLTYTLSVGDNEIKLANKEYQMMEMLMLNSKQYITTELFMDKIWGYDTDSEINVIWVYISNLRKKLNKINANVKIVAARKLGYRLEVNND